MKLRALLITGLLAGAACTGGGGDGGGYPAQVVDNFMEACTAQPGATESECRCAIDRIQATLTLQEFQQAEAQISSGAEPPPELQEAIKECNT